jgi:hypothetical protein
MSGDDPLNGDSIYLTSNRYSFWKRVSTTLRRQLHFLSYTFRPWLGERHRREYMEFADRLELTFCGECGMKRHISLLGLRMLAGEQMKAPLFVGREQVGG